jgi:hypothetical protein
VLLSIGTDSPENVTLIIPEEKDGTSSSSCQFLLRC